MLLWQQARLGDLEARTALIEEFRPIVARVVRRMGIPSTVVADREDLVSAGTVGLIDAVDRYEPDRGVPFEAYAIQRIRGAVIDEIRRLDSRGRSLWRRARLVRAASESFLCAEGRTPTDDELASVTALDRAGVRSALQAYACVTVSLDRMVALGSEPGWAIADEEPLADRDLLADVGEAVRALPDRERDVLSQYYGRARTLREIGEQMGVSEARVCQLHARAIANVRRLLTTPAAAHATAGAA